MGKIITDNNWVDNKFPVKQIQLANQVISYREAGSENNDNPVMVVLHGIGSGSGSWIHTMSHFEGQYRIIAWDAPGYNLSTPLTEDKPEAFVYARAFNEFLKGLGVNPKIVIGHSLGAMIAGAYAAISNPKLEVLILANPANGYGKATPKERSEKLRYRLKMIRDLGPVRMAEERSENLLSSNPNPEALELVKWNMRKVTVRGYEQASYTLSEGNLSGSAAEYTGRVLVLCGDEDEVTPVAACRNVAHAYSNAPIQVLKKLGHATYVEGPEQFNKSVEGFLKTVDIQLEKKL